jgi:hypothetical protein
LGRLLVCRLCIGAFFNFYLKNLAGHQGFKRDRSKKTNRFKLYHKSRPVEIVKIIKSLAVAMAGLALSAVTSNAQLSLDFSSTIGSTIQFNGTNSTFQFNASTSSLFGGIFSGTQWSVGNETGGTGSALGLFGLVNNSPFSYGPITTNVNIETANVIGPLGGLSISDGASNSLTGTVAWVQLETSTFAGGINPSLTVNVTSLAYAGTNVDLQTLVAGGSGAMDLTFQFSPGKSLGDLTSGSGPYQTSYSGSLSVPEPTSVGCFLLGMGVLTLTRRFRQNKRG